MQLSTVKKHNIVKPGTINHEAADAFLDTFGIEISSTATASKSTTRKIEWLRMMMSGISNPNKEYKISNARNLICRSRNNQRRRLMPMWNWALGSANSHQSLKRGSFGANRVQIGPPRYLATSIITLNKRFPLSKHTTGRRICYRLSHKKESGPFSLCFRNKWVNAVFLRQLKSM